MSSKRRKPGRSSGEASKRQVRYHEQEITRGSGGETHQSAGDAYETLTTQQGVPVADDQNSLKVGARGPALL
ncbi:MAG: hypothetical protein WBG86_02180, partial [Polyangiales bacterium]